MLNKEAAYLKIEELVQRFEEQLPSYKKSDYNETLTRKDFIDPFFKALGWDMDNSQGNAEAYREVIHEDKVKVGAATKAPDYSFKLAGGKRLFFVEAKKPSVLVKDEVLPAYQVRRYAWSAKLPVSILTDFEEFAIYDCTKKPNATDKSSVGRIKYLTFRDYLKEFDFIWNTFSKERVLKGSFDQFIATDKHKKGTATVDKEFLISLDEWRKQLALNIALRNERLTEDELNFVVQQTLDRLIFLRIAEDRGVEEYGRLKNLLKCDDFYKNLFTYFQEADSKYNSGLFDFKKDNISRNIVIDNKTIKGIINELYYPISPYEFSVLSVEILGSAYEQFLGKQIKLSTGHRATIEEKPEVRKAGGVYYTPQYIVEYIVENTVGKLTADKKPTEIAKLKIVDPACGSGSFLLGAYQYLLNWHLQYYKPEFEKLTAIAQNSKEYNEKQRNDALKERNKLPLTPTGNLTTALKKQILLNNIYGVDIDTQAVEVTKLSLLLKCMEGETGSSITAEMRFGERILPTLDSNIKSGNSLVDMDFYEGQIDFEPALEKKVKPFSWEKGFAEVFKQGGFDCVIGNPPWGADLAEEELTYLRKKHKDIIVRMIDSYMFFVHKSYFLLKPQGEFGMILPDVIFYQVDNTKLREFLVTNTTINHFLNLGNVFEQVTRPSSVITFQKKNTKENNIKIIDISNVKKNKELLIKDDSQFQTLKQSSIKEIQGYLFISKNPEHYIILNRIKELNIKPLIDYIDDDGIQRGVSPDLKEAFLVNSKQIKEFKLEKEKLKKVLTGGKHVKRYHIEHPDLWLIYTKRGDDFKSLPNICNYINQFKSQITCKEVKENKHSIYALHRAREEKIFTKKKKLLGVITEDEVILSLDYDKTFATDGLYVFNVKEGVNINYLLGILNSKLFVFIYRLLSLESGRTLAQVKPTTLNELPILLDTEQSLHDEIVQLVETMLQLQQQKQSSTLPGQLQQLEQRIAYTDDKINEKVYTLYGLSEEEVKVVEGR